MANYETATLDRTFAALGDANRRTMLSRLERDGALTVSALAEPLPVKLPTVLKHLDVLTEAGLVRRTKHGRTVTVEIVPGPLQTAMGWLNRYERFWSAGLDRLAAYAEAKAAEAEGENQ